MKHALLAMGFVMLTGCSQNVGEPQAADDSVPASTDQSLTTSVGIGATLETTDYLNLRTGPSTSDAVIEVIPINGIVSVVNHSSPTNGFYEVWYEGKVGWSHGAYLKIAATPNAKTLSTTVVSAIIEPLGSGTDSAGHSYSDKNYWNFCAPGAVTATLSYWGSNATSWPAGHFEEPYGPYRISTYWDDAHSRAYLMHIAEQVEPPSFSSAGLPSFSTYPTTGSSLGDIRDVLNWEASGHSSSWSSFFYEKVSGSVSATTLHSDVARDITGNHALVVTVDTAYLPNWSRSLGHAIAIVGYDDSAGTYAYVDTCGKACNGSAQATNGGVWHVSQSKMHTAIAAFGAGYAR